jgi:hypothetical protein
MLNPLKDGSPKLVWVSGNSTEKTTRTKHSPVNMEMLKYMRCLESYLKEALNGHENQSFSFAKSLIYTKPSLGVDDKAGKIIQGLRVRYKLQLQVVNK